MPPIPRITSSKEGILINYTDNNVILSIEDLHIKFTLRGQVLHALRGVSLDVYKGESLAIVGESGSGKSVFVKTTMGLLDANGYIDGGRILMSSPAVCARELLSPLLWPAVPRS